MEQEIVFARCFHFLKSGIWCVLVKRGAVSDGVEWVS